MNLQEINNLAEDPGSAGWRIKVLALLAILALILFLGYKLVIIDSIAALERVENTEKELRATFEQKQRRASQLEAYEAQLSEMQRSFGNLMQQLPSRTEIPSLIIDISEKGVSNGLEIVRFEPLNEVSQEFYAEKPIKLIALGTYKELATFVSDISGLPRIVTIHDIGLSTENDTAKAEAGNVNNNLSDASLRLRMEALIKTYRYLEDNSSSDELLTKK